MELKNLKGLAEEFKSALLNHQFTGEIIHVDNYINVKCIFGEENKYEADISFNKGGFICYHDPFFASQVKVIMDKEDEKNICNYIWNEFLDSYKMSLNSAKSELESELEKINNKINILYGKE